MSGVFDVLAYVRDPRTHRGLTEGASALLLALAVFAGRDGTCYPTVAQLAAVLNVHPGTVRRRRALLVAAGVIRVVIHHRRGEANSYVFPVGGAMPELVDTEYPHTAHQRAVDTAHQRAGNAVNRASNRAPVRDQEPLSQGELLTSRDASRAVPMPAWVRDAIAAGGMRR